MQLNMRKMEHTKGWHSHVLSLSKAVPSANDTLLCCVIGGLSSERIGDEDDKSKQIKFKWFIHLFTICLSLKH